MKNNKILSENSILRYFTFSSLYCAQGIPEGLTFFAIPAWMAMNGKTPGEIGAFVGVIGIPWSLKILLAPIMDRYTFLPMGRKRPWILLGQLGLIISLWSTSLIIDPINNLTFLMVGGFFISLFGAVQDIAVDGMAIDVVPIPEQARANGLMWGSKTIGISLSLIISTWVINNYGFNYAPILLGFFLACILLIPLFFRENIGEKITPWSNGKASEKSIAKQVGSIKMIFKNLRKVFFLPSSLILGAGLFSFAFGNGLMDSFLPVFTIQRMGWTNTDFAQIIAISKIIAGLLGMVAGGALVDFFGKIRMMSIYLFLLIILIISMVVFKMYWGNKFMVPGFILTYYILYTFVVIAMFATAMELCWNRIAATQFTLYMAINNIGVASGASFLGFLKEHLHAWEYVILVYAVAALIMFLLLIKMNTKNHVLRVELLESKHLNNP